MTLATANVLAILDVLQGSVIACVNGIAFVSLSWRGVCTKTRGAR